MITRARLVEIARYLVAGVVNTAFGYGLYAGLLWLGLDRYVAQAIGYVLGTGFNYLTYSRHVFTDAGPAKARFVASYAVNYLINLAGLKLVSHVIPNPYAAGAVTTLGVVALNYLVLRRLVFRPRENQGAA
ncbi:GtrA family protein [Novosphingobium terrae]|uniref:GtrA family protein n=1 Tax=Novosphingobium terrae TaxID=2726189 RepID=UPI00197E8BD1|nr:GtrA family protein [Novosphingobium terrae]